MLQNYWVIAFNLLDELDQIIKIKKSLIHLNLSGNK